MEIITVFKGANLAKCLAEYVGIIESISSKIDRLAQAEFEAGIRALNQAAKSEKEQSSLLREARNRFNKAISLEKEERLALSYLGLALCHYHLGDYENTRDSLRDLLRQEFFGYDTITKDKLVDLGLGVVGLQLGSYKLMATSFDGTGIFSRRKKRIKELKDSVQRVLKSI